MIVPGSRARCPGSGASRWRAKKPNGATPPACSLRCRVLRFRVTDIRLGRKFWYWKARSPTSMAISVAGTYFRNPPGSSHAPFSQEGCVLLVKLHQFLPNDSAQVCIDTSQTRWLPGSGTLSVMPLHEFARRTRGADEMGRRRKRPILQSLWWHGDFCVVRGTRRMKQGSYPRGTWLRNPPMTEFHPFVEHETVVWIKTGHLSTLEASAPASLHSRSA